MQTAHYEFKTTEYIKEGFHLFLKHPEPLLIYFLISWAAYAVIHLIPFIGSALSFFVLTFAQGGAYLLVDKLAKEGRTDLHEAKKLEASATQLGLAAVISAALTTVGYILLLIPGMYLTVAYVFMQPNVVLQKRNAWDALEHSRKVITKRWFAVSGFFFLIMLLNLAGACALLVGLLVSAPISICAIYLAHQDVERQLTPGAALLVPHDGLTP